MRERQRIAAAIDERIPVCVVGPAGIGKTTLVRAVLAERAHAEGVALPGLAWRPFAPLEIALGSSVRGDADAVAADVLERLGDRVLFIDDVHAADAATLATLGVLAGRVPLVTTARAASALQPERARIIELGPLPPALCRSLARQWHPDLGDRELEHLVRLAGGSPLLLRYLVRDGRTTPTLRAAAGARLAALPAPAARAVTELALLGRPVETSVLEVPAADLPEDLVAVTDDRATLRHALLGEAAIDALDAGARRAARLGLARRLPDAEAAELFLLAGDAEAAVAAVERALPLTTDLAARARLLSIAAEASGDARQQLDAAAALIAIGEWAAAERAASAVRVDDPDLAAEAAYHGARSRWFAGDPAGARELVAGGLRVVGAESPIGVRLLVEEASQRVRTEEASGATTATAERALRAAERAAIDVPRARLVYASALAHDRRTGWEEAYRQVIVEAAAAGDAESECEAGYFLASHYGFAGRFDEAIAVLERMIERAHELGQWTWRTHMEGALLTDRFATGERPERLVEQASRLIADHPRFRNRSQAELVLALSLADHGRSDEAAVAAGAALARSAAPDDQAILQTAAAEVAWSTGDLSAAIEHAEAAAALGPTWFGVTVGAAAAAALARFELDLPVAPEEPVPAVGMFARFAGEIAACVLWASGDAAAAVARLDEAAASWAAIGAARYELRVRWTAGEMAARMGADGARPRLLTTRDEAARRGLRPLVSRADASLARLRANAALTGRERAVLDLVAAGCTSEMVAARLGIAPATVESHVGAAMRKLGARTRRQAVAELIRTRP